MDEMSRTNWQTATDPTVDHLCGYPIIIDVLSNEAFDGDKGLPTHGQRVTLCPHCGFPLNLSSEKGKGER